MHPLFSRIAAAVLLAGLAPLASAAAPQAACTVNIDYLLDNALVEPYAMRFVVSEAAPFEDDFSTPTRQKSFSASLALVYGKPTVSVRYFNDVGVFNTIDLGTAVVLVPGRSAKSEGSHVFSTSVGSAGNHMTRYRVICRPA